MRLCTVLGSVTQTAKHPAYMGHKLLVVQPTDAQGASSGASFLAIDTVQAGAGDQVLVLIEGNGVRQVLGQSGLPIRSIIVGIIDLVEATPAVQAW